MKNAFHLLLFFCCIQLSSCGVNDAENFADLFHAKMDAGEYQYIVDHMIDEEGLRIDSKEQWLAFFEQSEITWGKAQSRETNFDFQSEYNNGITSVELNFEVQYPSKKMYERLYLVDRGEGFKVSGFFLNETLEGLNQSAGQ